MTYRPEFEIGPKSPGVWKEVRRLEAIVKLAETLVEVYEADQGEERNFWTEFLKLRDAVEEEA